MQRSNNKTQQPRRRSETSTEARVVDIRAWKTQKRMRRLRGTGGWFSTILFGVAVALVSVTVAMAIASVIPFDGQIKAIIACWFVGVLAGIVGVWLHILGRSRTLPLLAVAGISIAVALIAGIVKLTVWSY